MQKVRGPMIAATGDHVRVRRQPWRVERVDPGDNCELVELSGIGRDNAGRRQRVVSPIDVLDPIRTVPRIRRAGRSLWRSALRAALLSDDRLGVLKTLQRAPVELMPHQMAPALALLSGATSRLLIADDVGLGKTIQAGLILAELAARGAADRALVICPAGLREQWTSELARRCVIDAVLMDAAHQRRRQAELPAGVNPWRIDPIVVSSLDYVKRPEVLALAAQVAWDLVIVDEAHHAALASDRRDAVARLAGAAPHVLLLTATPHSGDAEAFDALCRLGATGDAITVFRRTRRQIGHPGHRRVRQLAVRLTAAERSMHAALSRFARALYSEHCRRPEIALGLATLQKRACSSAHALEQSVRRRLHMLSASAPAAEMQLSLPWDDAGEFDTEDDVPAWTLPRLADPDRERALLDIVADAAGAAAACESKVAALRRLLRRAREPVLVFTEYRDTLQQLQRLVAPDAAIVHGGLNRAERREALDKFARGGILLATDAAGEGLNLQHACRLVVNLELPWNPVRLEQRIGRVDRIGQRRIVHAIHLVARGTAEARVLARLNQRIARAKAAVGGIDPLQCASRDEPSPAVAPALTDGGVWEERARVEHERLKRARALLPAATAPETGGVGDVLIRRHRRRRLRASGARAIVICRSRLIDGAGRCAGSHVSAATLPHPLPPPTTLATLAPVARALEQMSTGWSDDALQAHRAYWTRRIERHTRLFEQAPATGAGPSQPGLFDARQQRIAAAAFEQRHREAERAASLMESLRRRASITADRCLPILVLSG